MPCGISSAAIVRPAIASSRRLARWYGRSQLSIRSAVSFGARSVAVALLLRLLRRRRSRIRAGGTIVAYGSCAASMRWACERRSRNSVSSLDDAADNGRDADCTRR